MYFDLNVESTVLSLKYFYKKKVNVEKIIVGGYVGRTEHTPFPSRQ